MTIRLTASELARLKLMDEGGEAQIYEYDAKSVLKLYKSHVDLANKKRKVEILAQRNFPKEVIAPIDIVENNSGFIGYRMKKLCDTEKLHQLVKNSHLKSMGLSNQDVLEMMVQIGKVFQKIHQDNALVGDVSDYNIVMHGKEIYFIDVDSWGIESLFSPDAYTEIFTDPKNYQSNGCVKFSLNGEYYSFAVLSFNMLSRIHPFNGTYERGKDMSTLERMKKKISVLGNHPIIIPKMIPSWKWMSPDLQQAYLEIFEKEKRFDVTDLLQDQFQNAKFCPVHKLYYYSKYSECPICNDVARVIVAPKIVRVQTIRQPKLVLLWQEKDVNVILSPFHYLSIDQHVVHIATGRRIKLERGKRIDFSENGEFVFVANQDTIQIWNQNQSLISTLERMPKTPYQVKQNDLYYVDTNGMFTKVTVTAKGCIRRNISLVYSPLFAISESGEIFVGSFYPKKAIIRIQNYNFELKYQGRIREYAIKQDPISKKWVLVYLTNKGTYRTVIFANKTIEYDSEEIRYEATPLSGICFYQNTIYDPAGGKIIGTNYQKNQAKEFPCQVVLENSKLQFDGQKFTIVNEDKIYTFGG